MLLTELSALGNIIEVPEVLGRLEGPYAISLIFLKKERKKEQG